ncbi:unnamed protein product [Cuscuta europaea]|uniref:Uncharacterized protein n=1 Tax=Cuscuta europaea TaxID=41803 RepID=A0A9P0Z8B1_CUSEU|nr:unnamed protein product [Cuscuta europaea]
MKKEGKLKGKIGRRKESKPPENRHCWGLFLSCRPESRPPFTKAARLLAAVKIFRFQSGLERALIEGLSKATIVAHHKFQVEVEACYRCPLLRGYLGEKM